MSGTVEDFLNEDIGIEDVTTNAVVPDHARSKARIVAKDAGVIAGHVYAEQVFRSLDAGIIYTIHHQDGSFVKKDDIVVTIDGKTRAILTGERLALNILQRLSGIATLTRRFVDAASGTRTKILDTRKTTPGLRVMEKYAVRMGGGMNHRSNLTEMALIKENHVAAAGSFAAAVEKIRARSAVPIEVEVRNMVELHEALHLDVDRIMLDNWMTESIVEAVRLAGNKVMLEASGNMTVERVKEVAAAGVDFISVGAITHSASALDLSLLFEGVNQ